MIPVLFDCLCVYLLNMQYGVMHTDEIIVLPDSN